MWAAADDNLLVVEHLIRQGANSKAVDYRCHTALVWAITSTKNSAVAKFLIAIGSDINKVDICGNTPLILATFKRSTEIVKLLLDENANVHAADNLGNTALHYAAQRHKKELINMLLAKGADLYITNNYSHSPIAEIKSWDPKFAKVLCLAYPEL